jgi:ElaB/YqjD/DUF883 family membrane-anchored ribosome-binding protein
MQVSTGKLMKDLREVVVDTEDLVKATAGLTGERIEKVRARAQDAMHKADSQLRAKMRAYPWTAVGIAAAIGLVTGILLGRR